MHAPYSDRIQGLMVRVNCNYGLYLCDSIGHGWNGEKIRLKLNFFLQKNNKEKKKHHKRALLKSLHFILSMII